MCYSAGMSWLQSEIIQLEHYITTTGLGIEDDLPNVIFRISRKLRLSSFNNIRPLFLMQGAADPEHPNKHPSTRRPSS
jgi:hypothetical protein